MSDKSVADDSPSNPISEEVDTVPTTCDDTESKKDEADEVSDDDEEEYEREEKDEHSSNKDPSGIIREKLCNGFRLLKEGRIGKNRPETFNRPPHYYATVNFIDPTTAGTSADARNSPQKFNFLAPLGGKGTGGESVMTLNLFERLTTSFERDYGSTLHSVPYEHPRTGAPGNIERLPIRTFLTQSHGTTHALVSDSGVALPSNPGASAAPVSDPAEWHNGPYCHVYIAACESLDHYRTKVRPSLQAFVSQIEGAASHRVSHSTKATAPSMNYSSHYVIVYVPIRTAESDEAPAKTGAESLISGGNRLLGTALTSRLNAARKQIVASRESNDSTHSGESSGADLPSEFANEAEAPPPGPVRHSSKAEKEIFKKFAVDFPNGRTCILSTLLESVDGNSVAAMSPLKNQEWNGFLRMLGAAVVSGFRDRCRRYEEEFRRLEATRAAGNRTISKLGKGSKTFFDLGHFFLVKESLAFSYEQMQIPLEALLLYEELRGFLPETSGDEESIVESAEDKAKRQKKAAKLQGKVFDSAAVALAIAGDSLGFRKRMRTVTDFGIVEQCILHYLYTRETELLFQMKAPVEILRRSHSFVQTMYKMKIKGVGLITDGTQTEEDSQQRKMDAELWALRFCWDVKCATDKFFTVLQINDDKEVREFSFSKIDSVRGFQADDDEEESIPPDPVVEDIEKRLASKVGELLEFARLRFLRIGDAHDSFDNPITKHSQKLPSDMLTPWEPWVARDTDYVFEDESMIRSPSRRILEANEDGDLLEGAFDSEMAYENRYLQIAEAVARCNRLAGRRRIASRLQTEVSEIYARRGDYKAAVQTLLPILDVCASDGWARCHFWHLFRLACCQRTRCKVASYLNTLSLCFGPHLTEVAPKAAATALQKDFEAVVNHPQVSRLRLGVSSFLETDLAVEATSGGVSSMLLNFVRKKLVKSFCKVGEEVKVKLTLRSYLPNPFTADALQILLVGFGRYEELFHNQEMVASKDAFSIMSVAGSTLVNPGENVYECMWTPMSTGVFALSTVQMQWKHGCFHYDSAVLRKPLSAIEVLPSDPTQTIELNPLFLIPGQIQQVRMTFSAGSDIIKEGTVELVCSDGLQVVSPGTEPADDKWVEACTVALPPCNADGMVVMTTSVKSRVFKSMEQKLGLAVDDSPATSGAVQTMQARVMTSYYHESYGKSSLKGDNDTPCMRSTVEAMVTTLDKPAFTVDECRAYSYAEDRVLISILLHCNTPVPFSIKEWEVELPRVEVEPDGDMNQELFGHAISEGEQLSLAFNCSYAKDQKASNDALPVLRIVLQDEYGKTFNQVLPLDLYFFYDKMRRDEEYAVTNSVDANLSCSALEGLVGGPVTFTIKIDASKVAKPKRVDDDSINLLYKIVADETDWIVGGKVKGLLECSTTKNFTVDFVGIPVHPGVLKEFPALLVQYKSEQEDAPLMTVHLRHPDFFKSLSFVNHMALACPVGLDA
jgi:hypothetical protein